MNLPQLYYFDNCFIAAGRPKMESTLAGVMREINMHTLTSDEHLKEIEKEMGLLQDAMLRANPRWKPVKISYFVPEKNGYITSGSFTIGETHFNFHPVEGTPYQFIRETYQAATGDELFKEEEA